MGERSLLKVTDITEEMVWQRMPRRIQDSHKGTYGKVLCVAGSSRYRGAAALCTEGALRSGCGIVTLAAVEDVFPSVQARLPEAILMSCTMSDEGSGDSWYGGIHYSEANRLRNELDKDYDALVIGPGMGNTMETSFLVTKLVSGSKATPVLDADALNALALTGEKGRRTVMTVTPGGSVSSMVTEGRAGKLTVLPRPAEGRRAIITPHPGEMARLCGSSISEIKKAPEEIAVLYAVKNNCIVVLKSHRTIIATPEGRLYRNTTGNSGLARGGSGDILAGMIGSLAAQGLDPEEAAVCGVWLHGKSAEMCSKMMSQTVMLPHDIFNYLGLLMKRQGR